MDIAIVYWIIRFGLLGVSVWFLVKRPTRNKSKVFWFLVQFGSKYRNSNDKKKFDSKFWKIRVELESKHPEDDSIKENDLNKDSTGKDDLTKENDMNEDSVGKKDSSV